MKKQPATAEPASAFSVRERELELRREIQQLREKKHMLVVQLVELDQLQRENLHLKALLAQKKLE